MGNKHGRRKTLRARLNRKVKNLLHGSLLAGISFSLLIEGAKAADWLFVVLAVIVELQEEGKV